MTIQETIAARTEKMRLERDRRFLDDHAVAYARRMNRMIEQEWAERRAQGLAPATRAEDAWRRERR